jgi:hypothetical protein
MKTSLFRMKIKACTMYEIIKMKLLSLDLIKLLYQSNDVSDVKLTYQVVRDNRYFILVYTTQAVRYGIFVDNVSVTFIWQYYILLQFVRVADDTFKIYRSYWTDQLKIKTNIKVTKNKHILYYLLAL